MRSHSHQNQGQALVEYSLLLVLVTIVVIAIIALVGPEVGNIFSRIASGMRALKVVALIRFTKDTVYAH